jgi:hypothetical protein
MNTTWLEKLAHSIAQPGAVPAERLVWRLAGPHLAKLAKLNPKPRDWRLAIELRFLLSLILNHQSLR